MARKRTPVLQPPPKEERLISESRFHELIAAQTGYSQEVVKRVVQAYWKAVIDSFEDARPVEIPGLRMRLALVYKEMRNVPAGALNRKRLMMIIDSPKYMQQVYHVRAKRNKYGEWHNMWLRGHQFIEL